MTAVPTFTATIYIGTQVQYTPTRRSLDDVRAICRAYVDEVGLCVTVTPTEFIYTNGGEPGAIVGLINYPRFPAEPQEVRAHALTLADRLLTGLGQYRVSIVMPDETVMLSAEGAA